MVDYTSSLIWFSVWPVVIYLGYKFTAFNLEHFSKLEECERK
jgi:hypothetical protein